MKNTTFDINRFGMLWKTELKGIVKKNWQSIVLTCGLGLIATIVCEIFSLILFGEFTAWIGHAEIRLAITIAFMVLLGIIMPAKAYGQVNERGTNSSYLLLPASRLEKFLSMVINSGLIIPLGCLCVFLCLDAAICGVFSLGFRNEGTYLFLSDTFTPMVSLLFSNLNDIMTGINVTMNEISGIKNGYMGVTVIELVFWSLIFLLGALYYKGNKTTKTLLTVILVEMGIGMIVSLCGVLILGNNDFSFVQNVQLDVLAVTLVEYSLFIAGALTAIWYCLKNLKA